MKKMILLAGYASALTFSLIGCESQPSQVTSETTPGSNWDETPPSEFFHIATISEVQKAALPQNSDYVDIWTSEGEYHGNPDGVDQAFSRPLSKTSDNSPDGSRIWGINFIDNGKYATCPTGYTRINKDLNEGASGDYIYLCYTTNSTYATHSWGEDNGFFISHRPFSGNYNLWPTHLTYTTIGQDLCYDPYLNPNGVKSGCPWAAGPSYITGNWNRANGDLNSRTGGEYVLFFSKSTPVAFPQYGFGNSSLYGVGIISGGQNVAPPAGWQKYWLDLNIGGGGSYVYFIYKT
ncbi:MAG: hypothetical protein ABI036_10395 [Fibrobacteria bacterium]